MKRTFFALAGPAAAGVLMASVSQLALAQAPGGGVEPSAIETARPAATGNVITRIVAGHPQSQLDELMPWAYAPAPLKAEA